MQLFWTFYSDKKYSTSFHKWLSTTVFKAYNKKKLTPYRHIIMIPEEYVTLKTGVMADENSTLLAEK